MFDRLVAGLEPDGSVEHLDAVVPGPAGVALRILRERPGQDRRPCLLWMHGGGYVVGNHRTDEPLLERWCRSFGCVVVSVDYRLAPEHPYPAPLDDCQAALAWVVANADDLGIDVARIGVGGSSAGAGLAAGLALRCRDAGDIRLSFQLLLAPMLDDRQCTVSSGWQVPTWSADSNTFGWRSYLGPAYGTEVPIDAAPARAVELAGLPPACVVVGGADGFLDECVAYRAWPPPRRRTGGAPRLSGRSPRVHQPRPDLGARPPGDGGCRGLVLIGARCAAARRC